MCCWCGGDCCIISYNKEAVEKKMLSIMDKYSTNDAAILYLWLTINDDNSTEATEFKLFYDALTSHSFDEKDWQMKVSCYGGCCCCG